MENIQHILHRYHYFKKGKTTINEHIEILQKEGTVWWSKFGKGISKERIKKIKSQLDNGIETIILLIAKDDFGNRIIHIGTLSDIITYEEPDIPPETTLIPEYYRDEPSNTWFKFSDIQEVDGSILDEYRLQSDPDSDIRKSFKGQSAIMYVVERYGKFADVDVFEAEGKRLSEGHRKTITVNKYERNPKARKECIQHYGYSCQICDFKFEKKYGELGEGFIEVHHKIPISEIGEDYEVDPINDLITICSNCHTIIHRKRNETMAVEELKRILRENLQTI